MRCHSEVVTSHACKLDVLRAYAPFYGSVSFVGSDVRILIKILRDTGAYIVDSVLLLSGETDTGDRVLSHGMGLKILLNPFHKMVLDCELVKDEVAVGVLPMLPIEYVHFILGNGLAGRRIWYFTLSFGHSLYI